MEILRRSETIDISDIDSDVEWSDVTPEGQYSGGWHINVLIIQNGIGLDDPVIYYNWASSRNADLPRYFYGAKVKFFIDYSKCTFSSGHKVIVQLMPIGGSFIR